MATDDKATVTPKLRFPKFREAEGWTPRALSTAIHLVSGLHLSPGQYDRAGAYPYFTGPSDFTPDIADVEKWAIDTAAIAIRDDTLITVKGSGVGETWHLTLEAVAIGRQLMAVRAQNASSHFIHQFLLTKKTRFEDLASGNLIPGLSRGDILELIVPFPSLSEQRKVAACLKSLDELIAAQGRKMEAMKAHKKGLMQQIFPRDGETLPRIRFHEFRDEWSEFLPIGQFAKVTTGAKDTQNKVDDGRYPFFVRSQNVERINTFSHDGEAVLTSGDGVGVGENYHYINGKFDFHQRVYCLYDFDGSTNGQFFFYYFSTHFKKRVKRMSAKNSVDSVRMPMITEMPIWMPALAEQQRIADCLSALDDGIAAEAKKLDLLKDHKKGLVQQLFPLPEESL